MEWRSWPFDPPKTDEDPADRLNLRFKRSDAEAQ